jgi:transposase
LPDDASGLRAANAGLRAVAEAKDAENALLRAELDAERELRKRLELRLAELERRLGMDSTDSGTPSSKERIGAKEARRARQQSERERGKDRKRGGQPGHQGKGLRRDPDPDDRKDAEPPAECHACKASLDGAEAVKPQWAQVIDIEVIRKVTEWLLPGLACPCCGAVTFAEPPPGTHAGSVSYGPVLNAAAVLLACYGNVPPERAAQVVGMLFGVPVSAGWADKAAARVAAQLGRAGFDEAMIAALAAEDVLAADETPVNVLDKTVPAPVPEDGKEDSDPEEKEGKAAAGAPHMLITRTPDGRLTFLQAIGSRRKAAIAAGLPAGSGTGSCLNLAGRLQVWPPRVILVSDTHLSASAPQAQANWDAVVSYVSACAADLVIHLGGLSLDGARNAADLRHGPVLPIKASVTLRVRGASH